MNYDYKYKKYKNKYIGLKNQLGGIVIDCKDLSKDALIFVIKIKNSYCL
jgi:hypothetical protein